MSCVFHIKSKSRLQNIISAFAYPPFKNFDKVDNFYYERYFAKAVKYDETLQKRIRRLKCSFRELP
jgi:hypothetical protein